MAIKDKLYRGLVGTLGGLGLVLSLGPATDIAKDVYNHFSNSNQKGIEQRVEIPRKSGLENLLGASAYAEDKTKAHVYNPREEFRKLGWELYEQKDWVGVPKLILEYRTTHDELKEALTNNKHGIANKLPKDLSVLLKRLTNGSAIDDKLLFTFVDPEGFIYFTIQSADLSLGKDGKYIVGKNIKDDEITLDTFRRISPFYGSYHGDRG